MRTATIALKVNVDDTKLVGHSAHLQELAALLKTVSIQGTATFTGIAASATGSITVLRNLNRAVAGANAAIMALVKEMQDSRTATQANTAALIDNSAALGKNQIATERLGDEIEKLNTRATKAKNTIKEKERTLAAWGRSITRAAAIVRSAGYLINEFFTGLQKSAERIDLKNTLGMQFVDLDKKIAQLKLRTANMLDRESILRSMALMSSFGLPMNNFANQVELINKMAIRTGQSVSYMMDSFARGISRLSAPILDNLGIQVVLKDVYADFAISIGKSTDELTKLEKQMAVTNYTLAQMEEKTKGIELFDTIASKVRSAHNTLKEWKDDATDWIVEGATDIGGAFDYLFGSAAHKDMILMREHLSDVSKQIVILKKGGESEDSPRLQSLISQFKQLNRQVEFAIMHKDKLQALLELYQTPLIDPEGNILEGNSAILAKTEDLATLATTRMFERFRGWQIEGRDLVDGYLDKVLEGFLTQSPQDPKILKALKDRFAAYKNELSPILTNIFSMTPDFGLDVITGKSNAFEEGVLAKIKSIIDLAKEGLGDQSAFESFNKYVVESSEAIIKAAKDARILVDRGSELAVAYEGSKENLAEAHAEFKKLVNAQEKMLQMEGEHDDKFKEKLAKLNDEIIIQATKVANLEKETSILDQQYTVERARNGELTGIYSLFEKKVKTLNPAELKAEEARLQATLARLTMEEASVKIQAKALEMSINAGATTMILLAGMRGMIDAGKDTALADLQARLDIVKKAIEEARKAGKGGGLATVAAPKEESEYARRLRELKQLAEARQKFEKVESDFIEKRGALLAKFDETKDVREIDKLYVEYVRLSRAAEEAGVYFSSMFTEQDEQIRLIWLQANAVHALAQEFDNANTIATYLGGTLQGFVGQDVLKGLSDFATSMHNVSEAFRTQGDAYTHMSAATSVIKSFTDFLIKDKKKLAWVNMVFEVGQAWAAWATPGMQAKAVAHSISAATFGLIAGGVLKLPSGTQSTRTDSGKSITPPPITINVIGDIAQTEADRGVMIQRSLDEARRMGRI